MEYLYYEPVKHWDDGREVTQMEWVKHSKPKSGKQYGFFGAGGKEVPCENGTAVRRGDSYQQLFGWLHDEVFIMFWPEGLKILEVTA